MKKIQNIIKKLGTPLYIYSKKEINKNCKLIKNFIAYSNIQIHYAMMCNNNLEVLKTIKSLGLSIQINSIYELSLAQKIGFKKEQISFTSTGLNIENLKILIKEKILINLDSTEEVEKYCKLNTKGKFGIRIKMKEDIILPKGHTNSPKDSDIGIDEKDFNKIKYIAKKYKCKINGIHGYLASNILISSPFLESSNYLIKCAKQFPDLEYINFGSGFGVPSNSKEKQFNFKKIGNHYTKLTNELSNYFNRNIQLKIEPGRSLMATAGILYAEVTNIKKINKKLQIAINVGFAEFARPRIYNSYHEIKPIIKRNKIKTYDIRANTVLQSDFLGKNRKLSEIKEKDILAIKNTGAYGKVMSSGFPGKNLPKEILI